MFLVFDTETTGFPSKGLPRNHPAQARVCQLAWVFLDSNFKCLESYSTLIKPDGWKISSGASMAHGITLEQCEEFGKPIKEVMDIFEPMLQYNQKKVIGHNILFDAKLIDVESDFVYNWNSRNTICTMELMTPICKLPSKKMQYKWPKLQEAYFHCFKEEFKGAHNTLQDVIATARVFKWLCQNNYIIV